MKKLVLVLSFLFLLTQLSFSDNRQPSAKEQVPEDSKTKKECLRFKAEGYDWKLDEETNKWKCMKLNDGEMQDTENKVPEGKY